MSDEIKPALTPDEWAGLLDPDGGPFPRPQDRQWEYWGVPHAVAAEALYGHPFGFTREDVNLLRFLLDADSWNHGSWMSDEQFRRLASLAARIQALLPPEDP